ncbi:putative nucleic acid-binding protein, contains PIN domain [Cyclonatronum proteinivorum]|uniref:Putative nucleic acid-binding protein, contains PIN domain n=1 Tax=Cyclonatronum proteinivorum TaxID=1457365 RepID=A0A345UMX2_9BACT|nr:PIN domain-containing protein [Cyclonatronum proteinivorum]AXJ01824.1 putative nucleic acid-binding protein, contains PIN domain [Cyclonatronum proteinivorum]
MAASSHPEKAPRLFLDTNILVDLLAERHPHFEPALSLMRQARSGNVRLCTSALSITTCWYLVSRQRDSATALDAIRAMTRFVEIIPVSERAVLQALQSVFSDFEDAVQYFAALEAGDTAFIITRNVRDFRKSVIPVCSARDYPEASQSR